MALQIILTLIALSIFWLGVSVYVAAPPDYSGWPFFWCHALPFVVLPMVVVVLAWVAL